MEKKWKESATTDVYAYLFEFKSVPEFHGCPKLVSHRLRVVLDRLRVLPQARVSYGTLSFSGIHLSDFIRLT